MSRLTFLFLSCLALVATDARALADHEVAGGSPFAELFHPERVDVTPLHVFVPQGFDNNDPNVQVVLDGELPSNCYQIGPHSVIVDPQARSITIRQQAYIYSSSWCPLERVKYDHPVDLDMLPAGDYEIFTVNGTNNEKPKSWGKLPVAVSTTKGPDDFLYAPLTSAHLEHSDGRLRGKDEKSFFNLVLHGIFNNSCMKFKDTKVIVRPNNVIEVLPIIEMEGVNCLQIATEFSVDVPLKDVPKGRYLIHIRSLKGKALNQVADL